MKEFVAYIVKNLVDHPDKVKINEIGGTQTLIIELSVEKSDIGKIIGKKGKTINAIRTLLIFRGKSQRHSSQLGNSRREWSPSRVKNASRGGSFFPPMFFCNFLASSALFLIC